MAKYKCNSCGETYSDKIGATDLPFYHVCYPDVIEHGVYDADGKEVTPEKRTPRADLRDERPAPGLIYRDGKIMRYVEDPETRGRMLLKPAQYAIVAEGAGRTLVE